MNAITAEAHFSCSLLKSQKMVLKVKKKKVFQATSLYTVFNQVARWLSHSKEVICMQHLFHRSPHSVH